MAPIIYIRCKLIRPPWLSQRKFREVMRGAHKHVGRTWHRDMLPRHFEQPAEGGGIYGYKRRSKKHLKRKRRGVYREYSGTGGYNWKLDPAASKYALVFTGLTRDKVRDARPLIRAFPTRARVTMPAPSYVRMKPSGLTMMPHMAKEITTVTRGEKITLQKEFQKSAEQGIERARASGKKTINA